jgi:hypothetical protein
LFCRPTEQFRPHKKPEMMTMPVLNELKKKADHLRSGDIKLDEEKALKAATLTELGRKVKQIHFYLFELSRELNFVQPDIYANYEVKGFSTLEHLKQQDYVLCDYDEAQHEFILRFSCVGQFKFRFAKANKVHAKNQRDYLFSHNLRFHHREEYNDNHQLTRVLFDLEPLIYIEFKFTANAKTQKIDLSLRNFDGLGRQHYSIDPQKIDDVFLDELAKLICREKHTLPLEERYQLTQQGKDMITRHRKEKTQQENDDFDKWLAQTQASLDREEKRQKRGFLGLLNPSNWV